MLFCSCSVMELYVGEKALKYIKIPVYRRKEEAACIT